MCSGVPRYNYNKIILLFIRKCPCTYIRRHTLSNRLCIFYYIITMSTFRRPFLEGMHAPCSIIHVVYSVYKDRTPPPQYVWLTLYIIFFSRHCISPAKTELRHVIFIVHVKQVRGEFCIRG